MSIPSNKRARNLKSDRWDKTRRREARERVFPAGGITSILYTLHVNQICRSDLSPPSRRRTKERPRSGFENWKSLLLLIPLVSPDNLNKFSAHPRARGFILYKALYRRREEIPESPNYLSLSPSFFPLAFFSLSSETFTSLVLTTYTLLTSQIVWTLIYIVSNFTIIPFSFFYIYTKISNRTSQSKKY